MTGKANPADQEEAQASLAIATAGVLAQVGCMTLALIGLALVSGLWLDARFQTRPLFTVLAVLGSVPVTMYLMVRIVLRGTSRLRRATRMGETKEIDEEGTGGENP
jgi:hypothetical protein